MSLDEHSPARVRSLRETAELVGVSLKTLRNLIDQGKGPKVIRISVKCVGVRDDHRQEWLDACVQQANRAA